MPDSLPPERCAHLLFALAEPERLRIISVLRRGPHNVSALAEHLGTEIVNVSHHLGVLRHAGLVQDVKQGRFVVYSLHPDVIRAGPGGTTTDVLDLGCCRLEIPRGTVES